MRTLKNEQASLVRSPKTAPTNVREMLNISVQKISPRVSFKEFPRGLLVLVRVNCAVGQSRMYRAGFHRQRVRDSGWHNWNWPGL